MARSKSRSRHPELQFVWPRDRRTNGSKKRSFLQGLGDILTNRGPDIFITRKHDKTPIPSEMWGNWAGYHSPAEHALDHRLSYKGVGGIGHADRSKGGKRYDPRSRKYVEWEMEHDWELRGMLLPKYTREEHEWMARHPRRRLKGKDFANGVPKRNNPEYQPFWQRARRIADNRIAGYMEGTDNIRSDRYTNAFRDRAGGTPGLSRRHTIGVASQGRPDYYLGGPGQRRQFSPVWADYDERRDNRGWGRADASWDEMDALEAVYGGSWVVAEERDYWGPPGPGYIR